MGAGANIEDGSLIIHHIKDQRTGLINATYGPPDPPKSGLGPMPQYNSSTERTRTPEFGRIEAHYTQPINAHTVNARYLANGKAYEL